MAENIKNENETESAETSSSKAAPSMLRLPYALAKQKGLSTDGMTPRQVWEMLKGKGIDKSAEEKKFIASQKGGKQPQEQPKQSSESAASENKSKQQKAEKTMKWLNGGREIKLVASYEGKLKDETVDLDGDVRTVGKMVSRNANLEIFVDGKKFDSSRDIDFWDMIDVPNSPYKRISGIRGLHMTPELAAEVEQLLKSTIEEGTSKEVKEFEAEEKRQKQQKEIKEANEVMRIAERSPRNKDGSLMTYEQARIWRRNYNNVHNEGEDGYIPRIITQQEFERAKAILARGS